MRLGLRGPLLTNSNNAGLSFFTAMRICLSTPACYISDQPRGPSCGTWACDRAANAPAPQSTNRDWPLIAENPRDCNVILPRGGVRWMWGPSHLTATITPVRISRSGKGKNGDLRGHCLPPAHRPGRPLQYVNYLLKRCYVTYGRVYPTVGCNDDTRPCSPYIRHSGPLGLNGLQTAISRSQPLDRGSGRSWHVSC